MEKSLKKMLQQGELVATSVTDIPKKYLRSSNPIYYNWIEGWTSKQKSLTVPNQAMSLREIANRFAAGLTNVDEKIALYDNGERVIKGFDKLDYTDRYQIIQEATAEIQDRRNKRQLAAKEKYETEFKNHVEKLVQARLKTEELQRNAAAATDGKNK